jgi:hypothetical protein
VSGDTGGLRPEKIPGKLSMGAVSEPTYGVYGKITKALSFRTIGSK